MYTAGSYALINRSDLDSKWTAVPKPLMTLHTLVTERIAFTLISDGVSGVGSGMHAATKRTMRIASPAVDRYLEENCHEKKVEDLADELF